MFRPAGSRFVRIGGRPGSGLWPAGCNGTHVFFGGKWGLVKQNSALGHPPTARGSEKRRGGQPSPTKGQPGR